MRRSLLILCWSVAAPGALLALLIILPAPSYHLWMAAVVASERSVWLLLAGFLSMTCAASILFIDRKSRSSWIALTLSLLMIACASTPVVQASGVARREGASLS